MIRLFEKRCLAASFAGVKKRAQSTRGHLPAFDDHLFFEQFRVSLSSPRGQRHMTKPAPASDDHNRRVSGGARLGDVHLIADVRADAAAVVACIARHARCKPRRARCRASPSANRTCEMMARGEMDLWPSPSGKAAEVAQSSEKSKIFESILHNVKNAPDPFAQLVSNICDELTPGDFASAYDLAGLVLDHADLVLSALGSKQ
jgi:hypothetical protein